MRRCFLILAGLAALGVLAGVSIVSFGLYNVSAAAGHLPGVSWILHTTFRNSVRLRAPGEDEVPDLEIAGYAELGARHYDSACKMCHGAPGEPRSATVLGMEPVPPPLDEIAAGWRPDELYWIVLHGVKMTGMPAWPAPARTDDVWPVVAFLLRAEELDAQNYRRLAGLDARTGNDDPLAAYCESCHGVPGGDGVSAAAPRLDLHHPDYVSASLAAYRAGLRFSGMMEHAAGGLNDADIERLAARFGKAAADAVAYEQAVAAAPPELARIVFGAPGQENVAACAACHGPWPQPLSPRNPRLAGQNERYLADQLRAWKSGQRGGSERAHLMHEVINDLDPAEIDAIAGYFSALR